MGTGRHSHGDFSLSLDLDGALFLDFVKGRPKYELGDRSTATGRPRNFLNFVPEGDASLMLWWYPYEGVIVRLGYEAMGFVNTISSPRPVDFNFGSITCRYQVDLPVVCSMASILASDSSSKTDQSGRTTATQ